MASITGWGRHPVVEGIEILSEDLEDATRDARLARGLALRLLWPVGTLRAPRIAVVLRTLAIRPNEGALQRPIVATLEPGEADAAFHPIGTDDRR